MAAVFLMMGLAFWLMANVPKVIYALAAMVLSSRLRTFSPVAKAELTLRMVLTPASFIIWLWILTNFHPTQSLALGEFILLYLVANIGGLLMLFSCLYSWRVWKNCDYRESHKQRAFQDDRAAEVAMGEDPAASSTPIPPR